MVCTFLRARNEGALAGGRVEEKRACAIAVMGNIGGDASWKSRVGRVYTTRIDGGLSQELTCTDKAIRSWEMDAVYSNSNSQFTWVRS